MEIMKVSQASRSRKIGRKLGSHLGISGRTAVRVESKLYTLAFRSTWSDAHRFVQIAGGCYRAT